MAHDSEIGGEVAVIIPCYNAAPYLARALESVFAQTYQDYRVYVIDDGSTDDTAAVMRSYAGRIVAVRQSHMGQASARNHGIRLSSSPYVAFLDADDEWLPMKLERQIQILRNAPHVGMLYSDCSNSGIARFAGSQFARTGTPAGGQVFEQLLEHLLIYTPTVLLRRKCLEDVGPFDESLLVGEDSDLWLRIAARWEIGVIPEVLAIRHMTPGSLSAKTGSEDASSSLVDVFEHVMESCADLPPDKLRALRRATAKRHYDYGSLLLISGKRRLSRRELLQTWRLGLRDWRTIAKLGLGFLPHLAFAVLMTIWQKLNASPVRNPVDGAPDTNRQETNA